jgi:hypothetical protein
LLSAIRDLQSAIHNLWLERSTPRSIAFSAGSTRSTPSIWRTWCSALRANAASSKEIFNTLQEGILVLRDDGAIEYANACRATTDRIGQR